MFGVRKIKICLVASRGGHLSEIAFAKDLNAETFLITEKSGNGDSVCENTYYVDPINRREHNALWKFIKLFFSAHRILKKEQPDCYISTGALISIPVLILGKLQGKKIIFIETLARVVSPSLSGKIVYRFADVFVVYWESLLKYYPKAHYIDLFREDLG